MHVVHAIDSGSTRAAHNSISPSHGPRRYVRVIDVAEGVIVPERTSSAVFGNRTELFRVIALTPFAAAGIRCHSPGADLPRRLTTGHSRRWWSDRRRYRVPVISSSLTRRPVHHGAHILPTAVHPPVRDAGALPRFITTVKLLVWNVIFLWKCKYEVKRSPGVFNVDMANNDKRILGKVALRNLSRTLDIKFCITVTHSFIRKSRKFHDILYRIDKITLLLVLAI